MACVREKPPLFARGSRTGSALIMPPVFPPRVLPVVTPMTLAPTRIRLSLPMAL